MPMEPFRSLLILICRFLCRESSRAGSVARPALPSASPLGPQTVAAGNQSVDAAVSETSFAASVSALGLPQPAAEDGCGEVPEDGDR